ncbi:uncharacterized protein BHQ10_000332 [Talaromyces amestolkiae]|uniref:DUF7924 domain-containing protein n=1 Tax=Talaromyces amestolkiae TaxID=1196081 RepID=A0A364KL93_TALAM|nr:uncharacterized protein BHQ10_000332 [Talaromyces amestolkiae]RAO64320.1 hypothetical protein BHQ10_000332 [Talaromyces amestolkiae]
MSQRPSKRSRLHGSDSATLSDASSSSQDDESRVYKVGYVAKLASRGCFMRRSFAGPIQADIALCERLLHESVDIPPGVSFEDEFIDRFRKSSRDQPKEWVLTEVHPLLVPPIEEQYVEETVILEKTVDVYCKEWLNVDSIYGPRPVPDQARGLKWSVFSDSQRQKLKYHPEETSPFTAREDMLFPYLTTQVECGNRALMIAERKNMQCMCIAMRALCSVAQTANYLEKVHRKILGFSVSYDSERLKINGYYPEIEDGEVAFYQWPIASLDYWNKHDKWASYRFVKNLDCKFLPIHTKRVMDLLAEIPVPKDFLDEADNEDDIDSQERSIASQDLSNLQNMLHTLKRQSEDREARHAKHLAQFSREVIGNLGRQEDFLTQLQQQKEREEEVLSQIEENIVERKARHEKLLAQFAQTMSEKRTLCQNLLPIANEKMAEAMAHDDSNLAHMEGQEEQMIRRIETSS